MRYAFGGTITSIAEVRRTKHISGIGEKAKFEHDLTGWKVKIQLGPYQIGLIFDEKPEFSPGDIVRFTLEKV